MSDVSVSIHQPNFMSWLKLFDKVLASDIFIAYDTVQYTRSEYHSRQKIKTMQGDAEWLSVPLLSDRGSAPSLIREVRIDNSQPFRQRHLRRFRLAYSRTPLLPGRLPAPRRGVRPRPAVPRRSQSRPVTNILQLPAQPRPYRAGKYA